MKGLREVGFLATLKIKIFKNVFWEMPGYSYLLKQRKKMVVMLRIRCDKLTVK